MRQATLVLIWTFCAIIVQSGVALCAPSPDKKAVIAEARGVYYNLKKVGLSEFRCRIQPDWETMFRVLGAEPNDLLPTLKQTHLEVLVGPEGAANVSTQFDAAPATQELAERTSQSAVGIGQVITGFFETWSSFLMHSPIPEPDSEYDLEDSGNRLRVSYKEGSASVVIYMTRKFEIEEMSVIAPEFEGTVRPQFLHTNRGLVLASYEATYKAKAGVPQQLSVTIEYQEIEQLSVPKLVVATMAVGEKTVKIPLGFSQYTIKK